MKSRPVPVSSEFSEDVIGNYLIASPLALLQAFPPAAWGNHLRPSSRGQARRSPLTGGAGTPLGQGWEAVLPPGRAEPDVPQTPRGGSGRGRRIKSALAGTRNWLPPQPIVAVGSWRAPPMGGPAPPSWHCDWAMRQAGGGAWRAGWTLVSQWGGSGWAVPPECCAPAPVSVGSWWSGARQWGEAGGTSRTVELPEGRGGGGGIKPAGDAGGATRSTDPTRLAPKGTGAALKRGRREAALHTGGIR